MPDYKHILCPVDFSEPSETGLKEAIDLATRFAAELVVLHVVPPVPVAAFPPVSGSFDVGGYSTELTRSANEGLVKLIKERVPEGIHARPLAILGDPAHEIVRIAQEEDVDLIVLATHGESGWHRFLFGSVVEMVVRKATCPVMTIPEPRSTSA